MWTSTTNLSSLFCCSNTILKAATVVLLNEQWLELLQWNMWSESGANLTAFRGNRAALDTDTDAAEATLYHRHRPRSPWAPSVRRKQLLTQRPISVSAALWLRAARGECVWGQWSEVITSLFLK